MHLRASGFSASIPVLSTQGGALFSLVPLVWESNPKLQGVTARLNSGGSRTSRDGDRSSGKISRAGSKDGVDGIRDFGRVAFCI